MATDHRAASGGNRGRGGFHLQKGMSILLDVFYRADFNADGVLSESEFKSEFCDRNMSEENTILLFKELCAQDAVIHAADFCSFIAQHLGPFREVLSALEDLTTAMCRATDKTGDDYMKGAIRSQFVTRLLLREVLMQLASAQSNVEAMMLKIEELEEPNRRDSLRSNKSSTMENDHLWKADDTGKYIEVSRDGSTGNSTMLRVISEDTTQLLEKQVNKLESLVNRLNEWPPLKSQQAGEQMETFERRFNEKFSRLETLMDKMEEKVEVDGIFEETMNITEDNLLMVVQQKLDVEDSHLSTFKKSLDLYVQDTRVADGCVYVSTLSYHDSSTVVIYEIWKSELKWNKHVKSACYKTFQHNNIEHLRKPEFFNTIQLPACWWKQNISR